MEKSLTNKEEVREAAQEDFTKDKRYLGHPKGLMTTSFMALAHAFANYGVSAILIYYLYATIVDGGLGFTKQNAAQFVGVYSSLSFMAGIVGGYVADRFIGVRKALYIGYGIKTAAFLLLAIPGGGTPLYLASQIGLLVSSCTMGTSLYALAGKLYSKTDTRRDSGFSIMYIMNNVGAIAPVITGTIALVLNYHVGFLCAGVVQALGLLLYVVTSKKLFGKAGLEPDDPFPADKRKGQMTKIILGILAFFALLLVLLGTGVLSPTTFSNAIGVISIFIPLIYLAIIITSKKTTKEEGKRVLAFVGIFIANCFNMMIWSQSTSILAIYAAERVNLNIFGMEVTPAFFQTVPAVMAVVFGTFASFLWVKMGTKQPSTPKKFGIGTVFWGLGPLFMIIPFILYPSVSAKVSPFWLIIFYALIIWGEAMTSPVGMASATVVAPKAFAAQMVTVWQLSQSTGAGLSTLAANFYKEGSEVAYFLGIGLATALVGIILWMGSKKLSKLMGF